jgi:putative Mn2+ efflux pump MntP
VLWLYAALIALISNLDNLAVGFALGLRAMRITAMPNAVIALITMAGTGGAMFFGQGVATVVPPSLGNALGATILIGIGIWTLATAGRPLELPAVEGIAELVGRGEPSGGSLRSGDAMRAMSWRQAVPVGFALAINNVGAGVGAGVAGVPPLVTTLLAGLLSLICVGGGSSVGSTMNALLVGRSASVFSGITLMGVGAAMLAGVA